LILEPEFAFSVMSRGAYTDIPTTGLIIVKNYNGKWNEVYLSI
jgi:hypothetical protein